MFRCGVCNQSSRPREKGVHVVLSRRQVFGHLETIKEVLAHAECAIKIIPKTINIDQHRSSNFNAPIIQTR